MNSSSVISRGSCLAKFGSTRWKRFLVIGGGIVAGILIGSGSSGMYHWDRLGPYFAGVLVALLAASLSSKGIVKRTLVAGVFVVASCMATIILRNWSSGHWPIGHVDGKWPVIIAALLIYVCVPGIFVSVVLSVVRRRRGKVTD